MRELQETEESLYKAEVPRLTEEATGDLVRRLEKERQAFDLDNTKIRARETRLRDRMEEWIESDTRHQAEETQDRVDAADRLEEEVHDFTSADHRGSDAWETGLMGRLRELFDELEAMREARATADDGLIEALGENMGRLQQQVLRHFGFDNGSEEEEEEAFKDDDETGPGDEEEAETPDVTE